MESLDYNAILLFKQQGDKPNQTCSLLEVQDFLLVLQTEFQRDMFIKHSQNGVCIDATYKINDYDFILITLLVLDDYQEGIPVAWAISNHEDKIVLKYFFQAIKEKCGNVTSTWFMSDMASQYFNAWKEVFDSNNTKYLWCAWHVDRAWRKTIKKCFSSLDEQRNIYHQLRVLMMETSTISFQIMLPKFLSVIKSSPFFEYFQTYCKHSEQWALCFRIGTPMNTNMYSESFHRVLKICYLNHKYNRRLDSLLYILKKIASDKVFQQLQKKEKGKHSHRVCDINKRHKHAESFRHSAIILSDDRNTYAVSSESRPDVFYTVKKQKSTCDCKMKCQFCSACCHLYSCTCLDSCTNNSVCKHIHLVSMKNFRDGTDDIDISTVAKSHSEVGDLVYFQRITSMEVNSAPANSTKEDLIKKINSRLASISTITNNTDSIKCLQSMYNSLGNILAQAIPPTVATNKRKPNENSEIQGRYFSTRKKRKMDTKLIEKPSNKEAQSWEHALQLIDTDICAICFNEDDNTNTERVNWVSCIICSVWVHKSCANIQDQSDFICCYCI